MNLTYTKNKLDDYRTVRDVLKQKFKLSANLILKLKKSEKIFLNSEFIYLDKILNDRRYCLC